MLNHRLSHQAPASGLVKYWIARCFLRATGWDVIGQIPEHKKFVLIGAHHTSNWDFPYGMAATHIYRLKTSWMGKDTLFKGSLGWFMRAMGGIPVDRSSPHGVVAQITSQLENVDKLAVLIAADGTRKKMDHWKSGFYWIAHRAQVPIVCGYLDYQKKQACIGLSLMPTGNVKRDMDLIRDFYRNVKGKYPDLETPVRLPNEDTETELSSRV